MKKSLYILLTCFLATNLLAAGTALGKPEHAGNGQEKKQAEEQQTQTGKSGEAPEKNQEKETGDGTAKEPEQSTGGSTAKEPEQSVGGQAGENSTDSNVLTREASREVPESAKDAKDNKGAMIQKQAVDTEKAGSGKSKSENGNKDKNEGNNEGNNEDKNEDKNEGKNKDKNEDKNTDKSPSNKDKASAINKTTVTETTYKVTVTTATYKGHNGYRGLLNAISHNSGKPAGAVLADLLLNKYSAKLTPEMIARLESIREQGKALNAAAEMLERGGSVTEAVYVQQEAILADVKNLDSYKKLVKLYEKQGKKSSKLFVNGVELSGSAAPLVRGGSTLVPLRTIAEALEADVKWNPEGKAVTVSREGVTVTLTAGSKTAVVNGRQVKLQTRAAVVNGSMVVPARLIAEAFKATVLWESSSKSVVIYEE